MQGESVLYCGRRVSTEGFRVFVYGEKGERVVANSWIDFQDKIGSGIWFSTEEEAKRASVKRDAQLNRKQGGKRGLHSQGLCKPELQVDDAGEPDSPAS